MWHIGCILCTSYIPEQQRDFLYTQIQILNADFIYEGISWSFVKGLNRINCGNHCFLASSLSLVMRIYRSKRIHSCFWGFGTPVKHSHGETMMTLSRSGGFTKYTQWEQWQLIQEVTKEPRITCMELQDSVSQSSWLNNQKQTWQKWHHGRVTGPETTSWWSTSLWKNVLWTDFVDGVCFTCSKKKTTVWYKVHIKSSTEPWGVNHGPQFPQNHEISSISSALITAEDDKTTDQPPRTRNQVPGMRLIHSAVDVEGHLIID